MNLKKKYSYQSKIVLSLLIISVLLLNVIVFALSERINLNFDLSKDSILDFDSQTIDAINTLSKDVKIISLIPSDDTSNEMSMLDTILNKYDSLSDKITYEKADTKKNPLLLSKYAKNSQALDNAYHIIFETKDGYDVVDVDDLFYMQMDKSNVIKASSVHAESYFTSSLIKATNGFGVNVLSTKGHGEALKAEDLKNKIYMSSIMDFRDIDLLSEDISDDADVIIIASPSSDFTEGEIEKLSEFLNEGKSLQLFLEPSTPNLHNLFSFLSSWGIDVGEGLVCDNSPAYYSNYKMALVTPVEKNEFTKNLNIDNSNVLTPNARPVKFTQKEDIAVFEITKTSENAFVKTNQASQSDDFEDGDLKAESVVSGISIRGSYDASKRSKIFVSGSLMGLLQNKNINFYTSLLMVMADKNADVMITPKDVSSQNVIISQETIYLYALVIVVIIPVIILMIGFIIWSKRRHLW